ncbi:MAG: hypothetical protein U5K54_13055 [Cytophagales bacterium]|nr:hypothetical protein [Cytophagales bacterium]
MNSLSVKRELNDQSDIDKILSNIGLCYAELGNAVKAINYF